MPSHFQAWYRFVWAAVLKRVSCVSTSNLSLSPPPPFPTICLDRGQVPVGVKHNQRDFLYLFSAVMGRDGKFNSIVTNARVV